MRQILNTKSWLHSAEGLSVSEGAPVALYLAFLYHTGHGHSQPRSEADGVGGLELAAVADLGEVGEVRVLQDVRRHSIGPLAIHGSG